MTDPRSASPPPPRTDASPRRDRPRPMRSLLILCTRRARVLARADDADPGARRAHARLDTDAERRRLGADRLPARRGGRDAGRRPARRHVRQAPPARALARRLRGRLGGLRARRTRSRSSSPAASCRASAAASSRSASGSSATSSRASASPASIGLISAILGIGGGAGLIAGGLLVDHLSYHWIFWLGAAIAARRRVARAAACPSRRCARPAASTCAAPPCSRVGLAAAAARDLARQRLGLGQPRGRSG